MVIYLNVDKNMADNPKLLNSKKSVRHSSYKTENGNILYKRTTDSGQLGGAQNYPCAQPAPPLASARARPRHTVLFLRNRCLIKQSQFFVLIVRQW